MTNYRLTVGNDGKLRGNINIEYNSPFPTVNGAWGSGAMMGVVMHTMVCDLPECIRLFNDPNLQVSAHFGIAQDGKVHQFGPIGHGWVAWAEAAGNYAWYSIEHADHGNPNNPLTPEQMFASAQIVECLSAFAGFPLAISDSTAQKGYGTHFMGGQAWGGHSCPDLPPRHVRSEQRPAILKLAEEIRDGTYGGGGGGGGGPRKIVPVVTDGKTSFNGYLTAHGNKAVNVLMRTFLAGFQYALCKYVAGANFDKIMPAGITIYLAE